MLRRATILLSVLWLLGPGLVQAQDDPAEVTVREINTIPQDNIDQLQQLGADLTADDLTTLLRSEYTGQMVTFTGVVLAEPQNSGLSSVNDEGVPSRVHLFVRDTTANSEGKAGMDIQIVDQNWRANGLLGLFKGDVIEVTAEVTYFENTIQLTPQTIDYQGTYESLGLPDDILDPVTVTTADINKNMGEAQVQANWENFNSLNQQYVRIEGATVWRSTARTEDRPNWAVTSDGAETIVQNDDISLCFRNDRTDYPSDFNQDCIGDTFEGPPPGATVNVQGFALLRTDFDPFNIGAPAAAVLKIVPWEQTDLEVTAQPSITSVTLAPVDFVPGDESVTITTTVEGDLDAVANVELTYETSTAEDAVTVDMSDQGEGVYAADIPAQDDGTFVTYFVEVIDDQGSSFSPPSPGVYRVLYDGINEIADIQLTADEGPGASPFAGLTVSENLDLTVTVQSDPATSELIAVQDDDELNGWSGILIAPTEALLADLQRGDVLTITAAAIQENFDVTELSDITYTKESGEALGYKVVPTSALQDASVAEAHEGMLLRFEDVTIVNPDAGFGEWSFTTGTEEEAVLADDASAAIEESFAIDTFEEGSPVEFIQGIWWFSFGDYKLLPEDPSADFGAVGTDVADETTPGRFGLGQNYPNPFNPSTTIAFSLDRAGQASLEVFDVLGRKVATLVDGRLPAGRQEVAFEAGHLPSGLYLYRLTAGDRVATKRMMLVK